MLSINSGITNTDTHVPLAACKPLGLEHIFAQLLVGRILV